MGGIEKAPVRRRGVACLTESFHDGLFGVPFFAHGRNRFFGHDRLTAFAGAVRGEPFTGEPTAWTDLTAVPAFSAAGADAGPAGGCG